ncbi:exodeoxyribonuclease VII small subunit [Methylocella sp.]|uniref:exodeoxyribonuclease VII small subunit n=1 Tax=Methylocella sp. TaxID=1978226 RepID=UPI003783CA76
MAAEAQKKSPDPAAADGGVAALPFEAALAELERIVDQLEKGAVGLEDSIAIFERGEALKAHCARLLDDAEKRIEKITLGPDGRPSGVAPLDVD